MMRSDEKQEFLSRYGVRESDPQSVRISTISEKLENAEKDLSSESDPDKRMHLSDEVASLRAAYLLVKSTGNDRPLDSELPVSGTPLTDVERVKLMNAQDSVELMKNSPYPWRDLFAEGLSNLHNKTLSVMRITPASWIRRASDLGSPDASVRFGMMAETGSGLTGNEMVSFCDPRDYYNHGGEFGKSLLDGIGHRSEPVMPLDDVEKYYSQINLYVNSCVRKGGNPFEFDIRDVALNKPGAKNPTVKPEKRNTSGSSSVKDAPPAKRADSTPLSGGMPTYLMSAFSDGTAAAAAPSPAPAKPEALPERRTESRAKNADEGSVSTLSKIVIVLAVIAGCIALYRMNVNRNASENTATVQSSEAVTMAESVGGPSDEAAAAVAAVYTVTAKSINIRSGAGTGNSVVAHAKNGDTLIGTGESATDDKGAVWYRIVYSDNGETGWVSSSVVEEIVGNAA